MPNDISSWYDEAEAYEMAFGFPPRAEIAFLAAVLEQDGVRPPARVLEPMVGTGRLVDGLEKLGFRITGFDKNTAMLRLARRKSARTHLVRADAARFAFAPAFDAAHCLIDSFRYLLELEDARRFMTSVAAALRPGAPFLLGLELRGPGAPVPETWSTDTAGSRATATILSHGRAGPDLEWMDATVEITGSAGRRTVRSRLAQRVWTPEAFLAFLDSLTEFEVRALYRRDHDLARPLPALPRAGGPIICHLRRG